MSAVDTQYDNKWRAFVAMALAYITSVLTSSMSFLVLPAIADDFGVTIRTVGWVVIVESLIVAAFLLPMGGVADAFGRRRVLWWGVAVFGVGVVLTGLAPSFELLIVARVVTAFGNTLLQSVATGILVAAFPPYERGLALGAQTTAVAVGSLGGPLLGGLLLDVWPWEALFFVLTIPVVVTLVVIPFMLEPDEPATGTSGSGFDWVGGALSGSAIVALVFTANNPFDLAWTSPIVVLSALATVGLSMAYVRWELAHPAPMLELRLFAIPAFRQAVVVRVVGFSASTVTALLVPIYLLSLRGFDARAAGLVLALAALGLGISAQVSGRLYDRLGARAPMVVGLLLQAATMAALAMVDIGTSIMLIAAASLTGGFSMGLWNVPANSTVLGATPPEAYGVGGAFTNVTRTIGNVVGQAVAAAVVAGVMASQGFDIPLGDVADTPGADEAFIDGWRAAFAVAATITALTILAAVRIPGPDRRGG